MPVITVDMWEGHSVEDKKQLVTEISAAFTKLGMPEHAVCIIIRDNPKHNWARGGQLASEWAQ